MRRILFILLLIGIKALAQKESHFEVELPYGEIAGEITTADNKPAPYVSIIIKELNKGTFTNENGAFTLQNIKPGIYTVEVAMVGLKTLQKTVELKADEKIILNFSLLEDTKQLTEVTVTSGKSLNSRPVEVGKLAINPMDLPQAITVIGQSVIRDQQALRLSEILKNVNGVYLIYARGNVQETFAARGYNFGSNNLLKNGIRLNSGVMPEISSLEKVEVLKGSAAILFGQVAPGAIVNMVTKEPKFKFGGEASIRLGTYELYKPAFDVYGPVNKSIAYRVNGTAEIANSFRDDVHSKRYYINPSFLFKPGKKTDMVVEGDYLYHHFTPDFGIGTINNTIIPNLPRNRFFGTRWQYNTTQQSSAAATIKHQINEDWKLNGSISYQYYSRDYFATEKIIADANGDWIRTLGRVLTNEKYFASQVNLSGKFNTGNVMHNLLVGFDEDHSVTINNDFIFTAVAGLPAGSYDKINLFNPDKYVLRSDIPQATKIRKRTAPVNRFGGYVQDLVKINASLNFLTGIRWSYISTNGIDSLNLINGTTTKGSNKIDKAFSPRAGIVYKPSRSTSFFASYANSFVVNTGQDINGNSLQPSIVDQYEIGVKNEFFKGLLSVNVTAYRIHNNNLAQTAPFLSDGTLNSNTNIKVLTGKTLSDGLEIDIAGRPLNGLDINAGYSYNYARYIDAPNSTGSNKAGETLVNNPKHTANASLFYTGKKGFSKNIKFGATLLYIGDRLGGYNNTVNQSQSYSRLIPVKGYTTIDLSVGYSYKKMLLLTKISNLTNTLNYMVHENYSINPIAPMQLSATVTYKF